MPDVGLDTHTYTLNISSHQQGEVHELFQSHTSTRMADASFFMNVG